MMFKISTFNDVNCMITSLILRVNIYLKRMYVAQKYFVLFFVTEKTSHYADAFEC